MVDGSSRELWDDLFRSVIANDHYERPLDKRSNELVNMLENKSKVLDLGCGMGRIDVQLAEQGHDVTAVDVSEVAIAHLETRCRVRGIEMKTMVRDLCDMEIDGLYDLIIAYGSLQFLDRPCRDRALGDMRRCTRPGGLNYIGVLTDRLSPPRNPRTSSAILFHEGELFRSYHDWETIVHESITSRDADGGESSLDVLIAKNPPGPRPVSDNFP
jgi:tellurite methyltransferase